MKFTFKKELPTGRYRSFESITHLIKLNGKRCGAFYERFGPIKIHLTIEKDELHDDGNPNCSWMNITLNKQFEEATEARKWLQDNTELILKKYKLHLN